MGGADDSDDAGDASHRALRGIQRALERHPAIESIRGMPSGEYTRVVADVAVERVGIDAADATLTVHWFAGETAAARPEFTFHYSDESGDVGWHHHPQDHVDGWGHVQERTDTESAYTYEPYAFSSTNATRVAWEVMSQLTTRIRTP